MEWKKSPLPCLLVGGGRRDFKCLIMTESAPEIFKTSEALIVGQMRRHLDKHSTIYKAVWVLQEQILPFQLPRTLGQLNNPVETVDISIYFVSRF